MPQGTRLASPIPLFLQQQGLVPPPLFHPQSSWTGSFVLQVEPRAIGRRGQGGQTLHSGAVQRKRTVHDLDTEPAANDASRQVPSSIHVDVDAVVRRKGWRRTGTRPLCLHAHCMVDRKHKSVQQEAGSSKQYGPGMNALCSRRQAHQEEWRRVRGVQHFLPTLLCIVLVVPLIIIIIFFIFLGRRPRRRLWHGCRDDGRRTGPCRQLSPHAHQHDHMYVQQVRTPLPNFGVWCPVHAVSPVGYTRGQHERRHGTCSHRKIHPGSATV
jgi:hypothetical protein